MESSVIPPTHSKKPALLIIVLVLLLLGLVYVYGHNKSNSNKKTAVSSDWAIYSSSQYGFKFDYPRSWGSPNTATTTLSKGKVYSFTFPGNPRILSRGAILSVDSNDAAKKVCSSETECTSIPTVNADYVTSHLKNRSMNFYRQDSSSYSSISYIKQQSVSSLDIYKSTSLPKINASAVHLNVFIKGSTSECQNNQLVDTSAAKCISSLDYNNAKKLINSIQKN